LYKYKLEKKSVLESAFSCEVCGRNPAQSLITVRESVNEFHKDGTIKIHYSCSRHIVDLYKKITNEIEQKQKLLN
jgi:hypothetical protein